MGGCLYNTIGIGIGVGIDYGQRGGGIPSVLSDGNTVAWFDYQENITKDGADLVSVWGDKSGEGNDLLQETGANQPLFTSDGILFDGSSEYLKASAFTLEQPEFIYMVVQQVTWTSPRRILDGNVVDSSSLYQTTETPGIKCYAGNNSDLNSNFAIGTYAIIRLLINGALSKLQVNETTATSGDFGNNDMNGFTLGARGNIDNFSNIKVKEVIIRNVADSSEDEQSIYDYLASKHSIS